MAQKEGIRHKKPLEYSAAAALGFLLIQLLFMAAASPILGKLLQQQPSYASEMMIWRFGRDEALGGTRENESLS